MVLAQEEKDPRDMRMGIPLPQLSPVCIPNPERYMKYLFSHDHKQKSQLVFVCLLIVLLYSLREVDSLPLLECCLETLIVVVVLAYERPLQLQSVVKNLKGT